MNSKCMLCKHIRLSEVENGLYIYVCHCNNDVEAENTDCKDFVRRKYE